MRPEELARQHLERLGYTTTPDDAEHGRWDRMLVAWPAFWNDDDDEADWLLEPLIAANRGTTLFAPGGTGKSLLSLWMAAVIATGRTGLNDDKTDPVHVLYLDYEMTPSDLRERLLAMGFGPDDDLTHLHYALLPDIAPADTLQGGVAILTLAQHVGAKVVFIDTLSRAVEGDENDADTIRNFYRHTGGLLKGAGIALCRLDHAGKDAAKGQRGSSAKNDDVDVVWEMKAADNGFTLTARKRRMGWVPETVNLLQNDTPVLHYRVADKPVNPAGTNQVIADLDDLNVGVSASAAFAAKALKDAGKGARRALVQAAQRTRRGRFPMGLNPTKTVPEGSGTGTAENGTDDPGTGDPNHDF